MPTVSSTTPDEEYNRSKWDEPDLRGSQDTAYPYNSVREFEAGQLEEYDSTSDNTRITNSHQSGSYHEILHDGTTTVKIVGDGYSLTLRDHNMYVQGDLNLTVEGNMRQMVEGDYTLEVGGSYHEFVQGNREKKVGSNDLLEIGADQSINIGSKHSLHCGNNQTILVDGNHVETIGGTSGQTVRGNRTQITTADSSEVVTGNESLLTIGTRLVTTEGKHRLESVSNIEFDTDSDMLETIGGLQNTQVGSTLDINAGGNITIVGPQIDLNP
jgi:type VI secretion system secreted protein VgrG